MYVNSTFHRWHNRVGSCQKQIKFRLYTENTGTKTKIKNIRTVISFLYSGSKQASDDKILTDLKNTIV